MKHCLALLLLPFVSAADVTVVISACTANDECNLVVSGDSASLTIALAGGTEFDQLNVGTNFAGPRVPTVPDLGTVNNVGREAVITFSGPVSARVDFDGPTFSGGTLSVNGVSSQFARVGSTWRATVESSGVPPPPPGRDVGFRWAHPTQYVDNSVLPLAEIRETQIRCEPAGQAGSTQTFTVAAPDSTFRAPLPFGFWNCFKRTVAINGEWSVWVAFVPSPVDAQNPPPILVQPKPPTDGVVELL